jgi:hypothetical protein
MIARWVDIPEPFLGNGSIKKFPLPGNKFLIMQQDYNNGRVVFLCGPCRGVISKGEGQFNQLKVSSVWEPVKGVLQRKAEE